MKNNPSILRRIGCQVRIAAVLAASVCAVPAVAAEWDIAGVKLGMTEAQARAALQAFDARSPVDTYHSAYPYSDGVANFQSPQFLNSIRMTIGDASLGNGIMLWFSGPQAEARVIGIARKHFDPSPTAPTLVLFEQSLQAKYGAASGVFDGTYPAWEQAGQPSCVRHQERGGQSRIHVGSFVSTAQTFNNPQDIENTIEAQRPNAGGTMPADLATCGAFVFYRYHKSDPVRDFTAAIFDLGAMVATERSRNEWVDGLEAEAIRKRQGNSQAPRL